MPNTTTAKKALRQNIARHAVNRMVHTKVAHLYNAARKALLSIDDAVKVRGAITNFESYGMRSSVNSREKKNISSRVSRLIHALKKKFQLYA